MVSFIASTVVWALLVAGAGVATWLLIASQSPEKFARSYIAFKFRHRQLPENESLFAALAQLATSRAQLMAQVERKGVRHLIHEEAEAMIFIAEQWHCGNDSMIEGEEFAPIVALLRQHQYPRIR